MAACDTNDLLAQIDRCLSNRGDAVMEAVFLASLCQFITFLEGEGGEIFACDIETEVEESHCLASQGRANVRSAILIKLCELFTVLGERLGPGVINIIQYGAGDPNDSGALPVNGPIYRRTIGDVGFETWYWNPALGRWE